MRPLAALFLLSVVTATAVPWGPFGVRHIAALERKQADAVRRCRFAEALKYRDANLAFQHVSTEKDDQRKMLAAFARYPEMRIKKLDETRLAGKLGNGRLHVPVGINGKDALYNLDTGANYNVLIESEAKRIGLEMTALPGAHIGDITGTDVPLVAIGYSRTLRLGGIEIENVPFVVVGDDSIWTRKTDERGALGPQVLAACQRLSWNAQHEVTLGGTAAETKGAVPLRFDGVDLFTTAVMDGHKLNLFIDTGADFSYLTEHKDLAAMEKRLGKPDQLHFWGVVGEVKKDCVSLSGVAWQLGAFTARMKRLPVRERNKDDRHGAIGFDAFEQASEVTFDFVRMRLTLK